jgi:hypothetical protein
MRRLRQFAALFVATVKEIFDESAYARFLARESREPSPSAYADFIQEKHSAPIRRCC